MKKRYVEHGFCPSWLPEEMRRAVDLSELAEPTARMDEEASSLMEKIGANVAIYKNTPEAKPNGLCSFYRAADLAPERREMLYDAEGRLGDCVIVAYANPLQRRDDESVKEKILFCWSGGKDSALALHEVLRSGSMTVAALLTTVTEEYDRISMHGVRTALLERQAGALDLPLEKVLITRNSSNEDYEAGMGRILGRYKDSGVGSVVFGDLFLEDLRAYRENNMSKLQMTAVFPLWKRDTKELADSFIDSGFRAVLTCVDTNRLDGRFAGREFDGALLRDLPPAVDPCGENGEFHTFVYAGPIFKEEIKVTRGEIVLRDGRFCFCDLIPG